MSKELDIKKECCETWNKLKDKAKMIDILIEHKKQIAELKAENERLNAFCDKYPYHYSEQYMFDNKKLQQQLKDNTKQLCDNLALSLVEFSEDFTMSRDEILEWLQKYKNQIEKGGQE